jgi:outer membrane biosynthesis protein TonB
VRLPEDKTGLTLSAVAHAGLLLWGLISFAARPLEAAPTPSLPVDIISEKQFSEMSLGAKNAPQSEAAKPLVDKVGANKPAEEVTAKVSDKPEVKSVPPPPEEKAEAKPEKKKEQPKVDPIAEALKKEEVRKKREEAKQKAAEQKKQKEQQQPKFDPTQIAALLDKRDPQRNTATGETVNQTASLGYSNAAPAKLSQNEIDALRRRLSECWSPPVGAANAPNLKVIFRVLFNRDGSLAADPAMVAGTASPYGPAMAESAKRALLTCQPFKMLRAETYNSWKDIEITFDPRDMFGG